MRTREEVLQYGLTFPDTYPDAPFHDENWQLVRVWGSRKAFLWTYEKDDQLCINVKVDPEWRDFWRNTYAAVLPGYHQNKEYWNTIILDGTIPEEEIRRMIAESYDLVTRKKSGKDRKNSMNKKELLFYDAYEAFYLMAGKSNAFRTFCKDAFGEDFSQDGFSDVEQIDMILQYIPKKDNVHVLDIGCGNGKMLGYLQGKTKAYIHGFDYSEEAIKTAQFLFPDKSEFREGVIGKIDYPGEKFDVIISMDTMYFAKDMTTFVAQIKTWLKQDGVFFVGYQEGDVISKTESIHTTMLSQAVVNNGMTYEAFDITRQTYELLKTKRTAAITHQREFEAEGRRAWFDMLIAQTECATDAFDEFKEKMTRYIYVIRK